MKKSQENLNPRMSNPETLYFRNILAKLTHLSQKMESLHYRMVGLEILVRGTRSKTVELGQACAQAFKQTKTVIQHLGETQEKVREDLGEYGGIIVDHSDWFLGDPMHLV